MTRKQEPIDLKEIYGEEGAEAFKKSLDNWFDEIRPEDFKKPRPKAEIIDIKRRRKPG